MHLGINQGWHWPLYWCLILLLEDPHVQLHTHTRTHTHARTHAHTHTHCRAHIQLLTQAMQHLYLISLTSHFAKSMVQWPCHMLLQVPRFLNRMLGLTIQEQQLLFEVRADTQPGSHQSKAWPPMQSKLVAISF